MKIVLHSRPADKAGVARLIRELAESPALDGTALAVRDFQRCVHRGEAHESLTRRSAAFQADYQRKIKQLRKP